MKTTSLRSSLSKNILVVISSIALLHILVAIFIFFLTPTPLTYYLLAAIALSLTSTVGVTFVISNLIKKQLITPIESLSANLQSNNLLSENKSYFAEYRNIVDALHVSKKQVKHHNKLIDSRTEKDLLTGLANRHLFNQKFEQAVNLNNQYEDSYGLILVNINDFKNINYSYDQKTGDLILKTVAKILLDNITHTEIIARTGNDEFAIIINDANNKKIDSICLKLSRLLGKNYRLNGQRLNLKVRIGATLFTPKVYNSDDYFNQAYDAARVAQKQQLPYELFRQDKSVYSSRRIEISQAIAKFNHDNDLGLYMRYQPKINLGTGELAGLEALTRLNHPELGKIRPDEFIDIAEEDNFISKMTDFIIEKCIKQASIWHQQEKSIPIAVNVSPKDLLDIEFPNRLSQLLKKYSLPASLLELEVTENVVIEDSRVTNIVLNRIKKLGVGLAIDDFGIGYSGFNNLRSLPFNTLKIDKSFVIGMMSNEEDEIIVTTTIQVAHKLGMKVVAEGIDNIEVAFALTERYCDIGQGFLYSRPVSAEIIETEYLRNKKSIA